MSKARTSLDIIKEISKKPEQMNNITPQVSSVVVRRNNKKEQETLEFLKQIYDCEALMLDGFNPAQICRHMDLTPHREAFFEKIVKHKWHFEQNEAEKPVSKQEAIKRAESTIYRSSDLYQMLIEGLKSANAKIDANDGRIMGADLTKLERSIVVSDMNNLIKTASSLLNTILKANDQIANIKGLKSATINIMSEAEIKKLGEFTDIGSKLTAEFHKQLDSIVDVDYIDVEEGKS